MMGFIEVGKLVSSELGTSIVFGMTDDGPAVLINGSTADLVHMNLNDYCSLMKMLQLAGYSIV